MSSIRKYLFCAVFGVLPFFLAVTIAQSFHHHEGMETKADCSLCDWQLTASHATPVTIPPLFLAFLVFSFILVLKPLVAPSFFISSSGRSPPSDLL